MIDTITNYILPAAYSLLPARMNTPEATALLLAIGLQESRFTDRVQRGDGPARGYWQFERGGGCAGVLMHPASRTYIRDAFVKLGYPQAALPADLHVAIADNDVLAAVAARLLLWTDQAALPSYLAGAESGWQSYIRNWKPGKPHRSTWDPFWSEGWRRAKAIPIAA